MSKAIVFDGNYYLHRAFNGAASRNNLDQLEKNVLTLFLQMVASDIVTLKGTHALVAFDSPRPFRKDIYPEYKGTRLKRGEPVEVKRRDGSVIKLDRSPGSFVPDARRLVAAAGIAGAYKKGYEADDLLGCAAVSLPGKVVLCSRDKDTAVSITERVFQYWPQEKMLLGVKEVLHHWGVTPAQIRDYLCLLGDKVDNIPGVPDFGPKTAVKLLTETGSIANALKVKHWRARLLPHRDTLKMARMLVTLKTDVTFDLEDLVIKDISDELHSMVWSPPKALKELGEARKASKMKGLFG